MADASLSFPSVFHGLVYFSVIMIIHPISERATACIEQYDDHLEQEAKQGDHDQCYDDLATDTIAVIHTIVDAEVDSRQLHQDANKDFHEKNLLQRRI